MPRQKGVSRGEHVSKKDTKPETRLALLAMTFRIIRAKWLGLGNEQALEKSRFLLRGFRQCPRQNRFMGDFLKPGPCIEHSDARMPNIPKAHLFFYLLRFFPRVFGGGKVVHPQEKVGFSFKPRPNWNGRIGSRDPFPS